MITYTTQPSVHSASASWKDGSVLKCSKLFIVGFVEIYSKITQDLFTQQSLSLHPFSTNYYIYFQMKNRPELEPLLPRELLYNTYTVSTYTPIYIYIITLPALKVDQIVYFTEKWVKLLMSLVLFYIFVRSPLAIRVIR